MPQSDIEENDFDEPTGFSPFLAEDDDDSGIDGAYVGDAYDEEEDE